MPPSETESEPVEDLESATKQALDEIRNITDPMTRSIRANEAAALLQDSVLDAQGLRNDAMNEVLRETTSTSSQLAAALGLSRGRVSQLAKSGPPPERNFLGSAQLTVALGGKIEDRAGKGKSEPGPVVAQEDFQTYEHLRDLADEVGLPTTYEMIPPPGYVTLNRPNLIVICGPRLSPLIGQILEGDPHLQFANDDHGWHLVDLSSGSIFRSPMDSGSDEDIAYFGRLPRPDGKGTFLYIAGIHAMGSGGVVHWLKNSMAEAYREVKTHRFSTLIKSRFDPSSLQITSSERIAPLYRPEGA